MGGRDGPLDIGGFLGLIMSSAGFYKVPAKKTLAE
jgi:hypothetical protein